MSDRTWECVERVSASPDGVTSPIDAVDILAILRSPGQADKIIVEMQYRPPIGRMSVEFPAGLVDHGEDAPTAALRELREETGYHGTVLHVSPPNSYEPGLTRSAFSFVHVLIDETQDVNRAPVPHCEEGEVIEVHAIPVSKLMTFLSECAASGAQVDGKLYTFAYAMANIPIT